MWKVADQAVNAVPAQTPASTNYRARGRPARLVI